MSRRWIVAIMLAFCVMTFAGAASAQDVVRVGWFPHPGGSEVKDGVYSGYNYDYLMEIARYTGWKYEFVNAELSESLELLKEGKIDIVCGLSYTDERAKFLDYAELAYGHNYTTLFTAQNSKLQPYDFEHFNGMTVGVMDTAINEKHLADFARDYGFKYTTKVFASQNAVTQAVLDGKVDAGVLGAFVMPARARILAEFSLLPYYFATTKGNRDILVGLNRALSQIKEDDPYIETRLKRRHFSRSESVQLTEAEIACIAESAKEPVTVGVINNVPLCKWDEEKKEFIGISMEILKAVSKKTGLSFKYEQIDLFHNPPVAWLKQEKFQLVAGILKTQKFLEDKSLVLSHGIVSNSLVVVALRGHDFAKDPSNKTLAVLQGFQVADEYIAAQFPKHKVLKCPTQEQCMEAVMNGRADATVYLRSGVNYLLQDPHYEGLELNPTFAKDVEICAAALSANNSILISIINKGLGMISDEERNDIVMNYSVLNAYELTIGDIFYKYRMPLAVIALLLVIVIAILLTFDVFRRRSETELKLAYEHEKDALRLANKASAAKGNFMSSMSHEIRTPLNAVIGYTSMARSEVTRAVGKKERKESDAKLLNFLAKSDIASRHLMTVINDVLDMSAIESGRIQVAHERFDFNDLIATLNAIFSSSAAEKGVEFRVIYQTPTDGWFIGDKMRTNQVLTNLLSNAVKFTAKGGNVVLLVGQQDLDEHRARVNFEVTDTGIGMEQGFLTRIWNPFEQQDASIAQRFGGTGLGLAITKSLVDILGGSISVESKEGVGSTFKMELCLEKTEQSEAPSSDSATKTMPGFENARVLLAEDNEMNMEIAKHILTSAGLTVDVAWNGKEAVEMFENSPAGTYNVILMDIQMPVMNGHHATRAIRGSLHPEATTIPIIAMTADAFAENVADALAAGMDAHVAKPIDTNVLFDALRKYIPQS